MKEHTIIDGSSMSVPSPVQTDIGVRNVAAVATTFLAKTNQPQN